MKRLNTFKSSMLAGICIGIAGWGYLATMNIIGGILFAFGLLAVVNYRLALYTGTAGFIKFRNNNGHLTPTPSAGLLLFILFGNITGCLLVALLARVSPLDICASAQTILEGRLNTGFWQCGLLAIGCGFIMTTIVTFARQNKPLIMFFGIPLFIICGFPHCVADAFYYLAVPLDYMLGHWTEVALLYPSIVLGNFIGCNIYRLVMRGNPE